MTLFLYKFLRQAKPFFPLFWEGKKYAKCWLVIQGLTVAKQFA